MQEMRTRFFSSLVGAVLLLAPSVFAAAQDKKQETPKTGSTVDAWRQALPPEAEAERPATETATDARPRPSREEVEQGLLAQEERWLEALKLRDASTLNQILADDFIFIDARLPGARTDRDKYLDHALRDLKLTSYEFDNPAIRFYGRTAVVAGRLKQTASVGGADWSGSHFVTDVWVYRDGFWRVVSRHASLLPPAK